MGKRDYAVLLLAARLGLRVSDIRSLRPRDIDWEKHELRITQGKTGEPLVLPGKPGGEPYYLMDLLDRSGIDFSKLDCPVELLVNGEEGAFACELKSNDAVIIRRSERRPG